MAEYDIPEDLRYTREDEWARQRGDRVVVGITDYAQQQLGDIVYVELPEPGKRVAQGEPFGVIESVKAVSDLYAPVSGAIAEVNGALAERAEVVNADCYGEGWICAIAPDGDGSLAGLLDAAAYRRHVAARGD